MKPGSSVRGAIIGPDFRIKANCLATDTQETAVIQIDDKATTAKSFLSLNALAWSAGAAVLTGFATCAGMARDAGTSSALGLYSLSRHAIDQRDTYRGMLSIINAVIPSLTKAPTTKPVLTVS